VKLAFQTSPKEEPGNKGVGWKDGNKFYGDFMGVLRRDSPRKSGPGTYKKVKKWKIYMEF